MPAYKDKKRGTWYANFYYQDWTGERKHKCKRGFKTQREAKEYERNWQNMLLNATDDQGRPYSQTYLKTINNQLSAALNYAVKHYRLASNPCQAAGSIGKSSAEEMNIWTREQFELFISHVNKSAMRLAFDILFYTGMRSGELLALTPGDVLPDKRINICKNYAKVKGVEMFLVPKTPKSKRCIAIPDFLYDEVHEYLESLYESSPDDRIFYFTKSALEKEIKSKAAAAGLPAIRVHDLRHSHASLLIELGYDILEIAERLGHESAKTTWDTYSHLYPDKDKKLAADLNKLRRGE